MPDASTGPNTPPGGGPPVASAPPSAPSAPPSAPSAPSASQPTPAPQPAPSAAPAAQPAAQPASQQDMRTIKVFGNISVSYPNKWQIKPNAANTAAVFTDGKASFEVHAPDPKSNSAQEIAAAALKTFGGKVVSEGKDKIAGQDAYWYIAKSGGGSMKIIGVDATTRVVLVELAPSLDAYKGTFTQMQENIRF